MIALATVVACKSGEKKSEPATTPGSGSGSAAATAPAGTGSGSAPGSAATAPPPAPAAKLEVDGEGADELMIAFDKKVPRLPALDPTRTLVAVYDTDGTGMPPPVVPWLVRITRLDNGGKDESLPLVDEKMTSADVGWTETPPDAATLQRLHENAAAALKRLTGWTSLVEVEIDEANGDPKPTKVGVGDNTLAATIGDDEALVVTLSRGGKVVRRATIEMYKNEDEKPASFMGDSCSYRPFLASAFLDPAKTTLYIDVRFRFNEECSQQPVHWIVWPFAGEDPDPSAALAKDAVAITGSTIAPATAKPDTGSAMSVSTSADGKSAWASLVAADGTRASYLLAATPDGWRVTAVHTSKPVPNAKANADAKANKIPRAPFTADAGDATLIAAFAKLTTEGLAAPPDQLVAIGTAAGERTTRGPAFARAWNAAWKGKTTVTSSVAHTAPSGTTGWVAATVDVAKPGYKMPLHVFAVFDKRGGAWTLVHVHLSV